VDNFLLDLVLEQPEVLFLESGYKAVERIGYRDVDQYDGRIDADIRPGPFRSRYYRFGPRINCNLRAVRARANGYHQQARGEEKQQLALHAGCHRTFPFVDNEYTRNCIEDSKKRIRKSGFYFLVQAQKVRVPFTLVWTL